MDPQAPVELPANYSIQVNGRNVKVITALRRARSVSFRLIRDRLRGNKVLISRRLWTAIQMFEQSDGYGGMKLADFLDKMFESVE